MATRIWIALFQALILAGLVSTLWWIKMIVLAWRNVYDHDKKQNVWWTWQGNEQSIRHTFSILDSWSVSLKLGCGANPLLQTKIFLRRKEIDFFPIAFFLLFSQMSLHLPSITLIVLSMSSSLSSTSPIAVLLTLLSTSKLDGQLRNLSNGRFAVSFSLSWEVGFLVKSFVNSFCNFPISSGVKSCKSWDEDGSSSTSWSSSASWISLLSPSSLLPNVPIASSPWGQSLNSSRDSCFTWPVQ